VQTELVFDAADAHGLVSRTSKSDKPRASLDPSSERASTIRTSPQPFGDETLDAH